MVACSFLEAIPLDRTLDRTTARSCDACHSRPGRPERKGNTVVRSAHVAMRSRYAEVMGAANEAHADCLCIITRAGIRMAREIDAAQERGEVATRRDNQHRDEHAQTSDRDRPPPRRRVARVVRCRLRGSIEVMAEPVPQPPAAAGWIVGHRAERPSPATAGSWRIGRLPQLTSRPLVFLAEHLP